MTLDKKRPAIRSITIELVDGRKKVIEGKELEDPKGGVLVWNEYGAKTVLKGFYKDCEKSEKKAAKTEAIWDGGPLDTPGSREGGGDDLPALITKPTCDPVGYP